MSTVLLHPNVIQGYLMLVVLNDKPVLISWKWCKMDMWWQRSTIVKSYLF